MSVSKLKAFVFILCLLQPITVSETNAINAASESDDIAVTGNAAAEQLYELERRRMGESKGGMPYISPSNIKRFPLGMYVDPDPSFKPYTRRPIVTHSPILSLCTF